MTATKPIKVCLLGASLSTGNMGVSALVSGTVVSVRASHPNAEVFLFDYGKEPATYQVHCPDGVAEVELANIRFSKKFYLRNNIAWLLFLAVATRLIPSKGWRRSLLMRNAWLKRLLEADIVASIAYGDSFSDIYGLVRLLYIALPQILVLQLGKPLVLLPQTLGPFKSGLARAIGGYIMRHAQVVYSRDKTSFDEITPLMGSEREKLKFSHDMAFLLEPVRPEAGRLGALPAGGGATPLVGLNISGLLLMGGYTRDNMFGLKTDYARLMNELIDYFVKNQGADVVLVAHVFGEDAESDTSACARVFEELRPEYGERLHLLRGDFNQHEIKHVIGRCDFFLGARMHACIAALSQTVPAVCLAYSRKFVGVMDSLGCAELAVDLRALDTDATFAAVRRIYLDRAKTRVALQARMPEVRRGVASLFSPRGPANN